MTKTMKRMLSLMLVLCMALALMPTAFATNKTMADINVMAGDSVQVKIDGGWFSSFSSSNVTYTGLEGSGLTPVVAADNDLKGIFLKGSAENPGTYSYTITAKWDASGKTYTNVYSGKVVVGGKVYPKADINTTAGTAVQEKIDGGWFSSFSSSNVTYTGLEGSGLTPVVAADNELKGIFLKGTAAKAGTYSYKITAKWDASGKTYAYIYTGKVIIAEAPVNAKTMPATSFTVKAGENFNEQIGETWWANTQTLDTSTYTVNPSVTTATPVIGNSGTYQGSTLNNQFLYLKGSIATPGTYQYSVVVSWTYNGNKNMYTFPITVTVQPSTTTQTVPATTFSVKAGEKFDRQITESWWSTSVALKTSYTVSPTVSTAAPAIAKSGTYQGSTLNNQFLHLQGSIGKVGIYKYEIVVNWSNNGNEFKYIFPVTVTVTGDTFVNPFTDVKPSDWFYSDVMSAVKMGLVNGMTPTTYEPKGNLTICQAIKLAACMNQYYTDGQVTLQNSPTGNWYDSYVNYAIKKGIITYDQFEGQYNNTATRANYVMIFANALPDSEFKAINTIKDNSIPDVKTTDLYGAAVYKLYRAGILTGSGDAATYRYFLPKNNIIRSEVAAILTRMMDQTARMNFTI